jgi:hypothetical protein
MTRLLVGLLATWFVLVPAVSLRADPPEPKKTVVKPPLLPTPGTPADDAPAPLKPPDRTAPPSPEPLLIKPAEIPPPAAPKDEAGKSYDVLSVAPTPGSKPSDGLLAIGFFNHSDRDLVLEIDKRTINLKSRYYVELKLPREFNWREKEGPLQTTKVAADADGVEIVFRK